MMTNGSSTPSERRLRLSPRAVLSEFRDGAVLLDLRTKRYLVLNATGGLVCQLLGKGATLAEISAALGETFAVSRGEAERDTARLIEELEAEELLTPA